MYIVNRFDCGTFSKDSLVTDSMYNMLKLKITHLKLALNVRRNLIKFSNLFSYKYIAYIPSH